MELDRARSCNQQSHGGSGHVPVRGRQEGHAAGDTLLAGVVAAIRDRLRAYDLVIRWGGDELVCILPDATRAEAERTLADIEQHVRDRTSGRSVSSGLAALQSGDTAASLVNRADQALYARREAIRARA